MPRSWSEASKDCAKHPRKRKGRSCSCRVGWRYRLGVPDPVTGLIGKAEWSPRFPTKEVADRHQRELRQAIAEQSFTHDRGTTVGQFLDDWLERQERARRKATTVNGYRRIVENHLSPALGRHRLGDLRVDHVQAMLDRIASSPSLRLGRGRERRVTAGTLRNIRAVLRAALNDAMRRQLVQRNVATLVTMPRVRRPEPIAIEPDRLQLFAKLAADHELACLWYLAMVYGWRRAELVGIGWDNIDHDTGLIHLNRTIVDVPGDHHCPRCRGRHRRILFDIPKTPAGERIYPLVPSVAEALSRQRSAQDRGRELFGADFRDHGLVFQQPDGTPWRPDWVSREFKRLMRESGAAEGAVRIPSLKALRSTAVTNLHEEGVSIEVISKITGHVDDAVTREHYLAVTAERTRAEFEVLAERLSPGRSDPQSDPKGVEATKKEVAPPMN